MIDVYSSTGETFPNNHFRIPAAMKPKSCLHAAAQFVCQLWFPAKRGCLMQAVHSIDAFLGPLSPQKALNAACQAGALESTLEYFLSRSTPDWKEAVRAAAEGGHLHVLQWMTNRQDGRGPWKADFDNMLEVAASHGHFDVAKWLFERGMDWHTLRRIDSSSAGFIEKSWLYEHCTVDALELAARHGHFEMVQWIYRTRTDNCMKYRNPMSSAVANGHLAIAQWLHHVGREECSAQAVDKAAENGHLEVLEWVHANHLFQCTTAVMNKSAENGHFEVVKWLHRVHHACCSTLALYLAVNNGHLELVEWLYENVYIKCHRYAPYMNAISAAEHGHLEVVKWVHEHFPGSFSSHEMDAAARNGHMDVITWLHENRSDGCSDMATLSAAQYGHLETLKWFHMHYPNKFCSSDAMDDLAAENGHLDVVRWLHENQPEGFTRYAMYLAALKGHLDTFLYLLEHRTGSSRYNLHDAQDIQVLCNFNSDDRRNGRSNRATSDQLKMLQTLFERHPLFVQDCLRCLAYIACIGRGPNIAILDWVNQFGIELNSTAPIRDAVHRGDVKMLQWFFENGFEVMHPGLLKMAVERGRLDVVHWLSEHGYAVDSLELVKIAGVKHNVFQVTMVPMMRWLVEHGPPLDLSTATTLVLENRHFEIAWWVAEKYRSQLVLEALHKNDREVIWWILAHTQFQDEGARQSIHEAIHRCPKDTQQWLEDNMSNVETCRWCFSTSIKRCKKESGETGLTSSKRQRSDEGLSYKA